MGLNLHRLSKREIPYYTDSSSVRFYQNVPIFGCNIHERAYLKHGAKLKSGY